MNDSPIRPDETLARFILRSEYVRNVGSVRPDPFIPYRHTELSVTRHGECESTLWHVGEFVATSQRLSLVGRGDIVASDFPKPLLAMPAPLAENPNHANVVGWPSDKQSQKELAIEIVRHVTFVSAPGSR